MSHQMNQDLPPSTRLVQMILGYSLSQAIAAAALCGVADALKDGPKTIDELALATGTHARSLYRLLRALASAAIFSEGPDGRFSLTPLAEPLRSDAPDSLRAYAIMTGSEWFYNTWAQLPYSIRNGEPAFEHLHGKSVFEYLAENPAAAKIFDDGMTSLSKRERAAVIGAYDFSGITRLVDVGGGHGLLLATILQKYPQMNGVLFDTPPVIEGAKRAIEEQSLAGRCELIAGDFFRSVPQGGDAYIMKSILHDWDDERAVTILRNCRAAMREGGKILVVETVLPEGDAPSLGKLNDLIMLVFLRGLERTEAEWHSLCDRAGLRTARLVPTQSHLDVIECISK